MVAHGAYQLLAEGTPGAVSPSDRQEELDRLLHQVRSGPASEVARAALPAAQAAELAERALLPDRFYRQVFERWASEAQPVAAALYLPALDLAADGWRGGEVAFADLVRSELAESDRLLAGQLGRWDTVAVVFDPGRRTSGGRGRVLLWRRAGCSGLATELAIGSLSSGLLRDLGLPQSAELPPPPQGCVWPAPPSRVASYGRRDTEPADVSAAAHDQGDAEYLENLRSLGYL